MRRILPLVVLLPLIGCDPPRTQRDTITTPPPVETVKDGPGQKIEFKQNGADQDSERPAGR